MVPKFLWNNILSVLADYDGKAPLSEYLKQFFKKHPNAGSRDRRMVADAVFAWYRCAHGFDGTALEPATVEKVEQCILLMESDGILPAGFDLQRLFPYDIGFSAGINRQIWLASMLRKPDVFIRVRKNKTSLLSKLHEAGLNPKEIFDDCLALPPKSDIAKILDPQAFVVQDASSQLAAEFFDPKPQSRWLDCCCGAGGKSLVLVDKEPTVNLVVTDRRKSIVHNLKERFKGYGLRVPNAQITDAADPVALASTLGTGKFDGIICDVPCSGSGTWARTPEQLHFFNPAVLPEFQAVQAAIASNVARFLAPGGKLHYITCSVFEIENEAVVAKIARDSGLRVITMESINGLDRNSDSMFSAVLAR